MKLSKIQDQFVSGLYDDNQKDILELIKDGKAPKQELLNIYRNNLYSNLSNALKITYPKIHQLIGEKKFKKSCAEFIKYNPSKTGNLDDYGQGFNKFLEQNKEPFLSDLACLEWMMHKSYLAKDVAVLNFEALQNLEQEKLFEVKFGLHPSCFLYSSLYNLLAENRRNYQRKRPVYFVIYRQNFEVMVEKIPKEEFDFLSGVEKGLNLYQIYEKYHINLGFCLQKYLANTVLSEFFINP
ncbi:MAG: hypothetical protein K0R25_472 [Rickettsiaceae bacterium]|jgi:hypothetical protein|nr:hypothetical protein [Rickettsiaceae bacterium]